MASGQLRDVRTARSDYPATETWAYFNTAAVGLASRAVEDAYGALLNEWLRDGFDFLRGEAAAESARSSVAALMGADRKDVALIPSVSAAAGLVAAQLGQSEGDENVVIGERESAPTTSRGANWPGRDTTSVRSSFGTAGSSPRRSRSLSTRALA
jgi:selenocysteine lyase/cysteine desulfurase